MATHGIVVDHLETGVRYAVSEENFDEKINRRVRDLRPGESVLAYKPKPRQANGGAEGGSQPQDEPADSSDEPGLALAAPTEDSPVEQYDTPTPDEDPAPADVPDAE